jgi:hypothetical protein
MKKNPGLGKLGNVLLRIAGAMNYGPQHHSGSVNLWQFMEKNKMASFGSSYNFCPTIGRSQQSQRDMPRDKYELEAES